MQVHFSGKNLEVTDALKEFTTDKFKSLEKRYHQIKNINVLFYIERESQIAEATVHLHTTEIHAIAKENDMYKAIDLLVAKLLGQITKHKEKLIDSHR